MASSTGATCGYSTPRRATWSRLVFALAGWSPRGRRRRVGPDVRRVLGWLWRGLRLAGPGPTRLASHDAGGLRDWHRLAGRAVRAASVAASFRRASSAARAG